MLRLKALYLNAAEGRLSAVTKEKSPLHSFLVVYAEVQPRPSRKSSCYPLFFKTYKACHQHAASSLQFDEAYCSDQVGGFFFDGYPHVLVNVRFFLSLIRSKARGRSHGFQD